MIAIAAVAMQVAAPTAAAAVFAPPIDTPIRLLETETRDYDGDATRYASERVVTFRRRTGGYVAEVRTLPSRGDAKANGSPSAESALNALAGRTVTIALDTRGRTISVNDDAALWTLVVDGIARDMANQKHKAASAPAMIAQLRKFPAPQRTAMIGGIVSPIVDTDLAGAGVRDAFPVTTTLRAPDGTEIALSGTERRYRAADGAIVLERKLTGESGERRVAMTIMRRADPATGVARASRQQTDWWIAGGHLRQVRTTDISTR